MLFTREDALWNFPRKLFLGRRCKPRESVFIVYKGEEVMDGVKIEA